MPRCCMRVYIPLDRRALEALARSGTVPPGRGYAVTAALATVSGTDDDELLEYAALTLAASNSRVLPIVVVAADVTSVQSEDAASPGEVVVGDPVPLSAVASFHVGDDAAELAWYATQELDEVLAVTSSG